jgi:type IX secretion system PorP/SprF family membrane protein
LKAIFKYIFILCICSLSSYAQQLPYYTQNKTNDLLFNPAVAGTKRLIDARLSYRAQWLGFDGAPQTAFLNMHSRFMKGKMGFGVYLLQDKIGPFQQTNLGISYAYHVRFPDCELSAGIAGNFSRFALKGSDITVRYTQDPVVDQSVTDITKAADGSAGIFLYNDRFHIGISAIQLIQSEASFYDNDSTKKGVFKYVTHWNASLRYNYSQNPDYIWENTVYISYVQGAPTMLDYTLRLHYLEKVFAGVCVRIKNSVGLQIGYTFKEIYQVRYSYDMATTSLRATNSGSHEIMLIISSNLFNGNKKKGFSNDKFLNQKYGYLF